MGHRMYALKTVTSFYNVQCKRTQEAQPLLWWPIVLLHRLNKLITARFLFLTLFIVIAPPRPVNKSKTRFRAGRS